jgi:hypothetical protein
VTSVLAASLALSTARADPQRCPLIGDDRESFDSANGKVFAAPGPKQKSTLVFRRLGSAAEAVEKLWEMPGWHPWSYVSDDGEYLVWCLGMPSGRRRRPDEVMVSVFRRGTLVTAIRLNQIVVDPTSMGPSRTAAYPWGECKGFVALHDFSLLTLESRRLIYDVTTGELVEAVFVDRGKPPSETTMDDLWDDPPMGRTLPGTVSATPRREACCAGRGRPGTAEQPAAGPRRGLDGVSR